MTEEAPELDDALMDAVRRALRAADPMASKVDLTSVAVDVLREITLAGYTIRRNTAGRQS